MGNQNQIHSLTLLPLVLFSYVSAEYYHIIPHNSTSHCQNYSTGTCFTLAEFAMNISHLDHNNNLTLSFLPGEHLLARRLTINAPQNIALTGQDASNSSTSTVQCQGTSGFEFGDIQSLTVAYLEFNGCGNVTYGGAIAINRVDMFLVEHCHFINNHVTLNGGAIYVGDTEAMKIEVSTFNNNSALSDHYSYGGAICVVNGFIFTINSNYIHNTVHTGGAIYVSSGNIHSTSDYYIHNSADDGGAISVSGNMYSISNYYVNNSGGAISVNYGNMYSISNYYINNSGGAISVNYGNMYSTSDYYINNNADDSGGAISAVHAKIYSTSNYYINNIADYSGGAIYVYPSNTYTNGDYYINNSANLGGAIRVFAANIYSTSNYYINNIAGSGGGAIYISDGNIFSTSNHYINNSVGLSTSLGGGVIFMDSGGSCSLYNDNFKQNTAFEGAIISQNEGTLEIGQCNITDNFAINKGILYLDTVTLVITGVNFINNQGSLYVSSTQVQINGVTTFMNNLGDFGGAITAIQSQITINTSSVTIRNNTATNGGGIYLAHSNLHVYHPFELTDNKVTEYGGGIYASRSEIEFTSDSDSEQTQIIQISNNTALSGGALCAIASSIEISKTHIDFNLNRATMNGGAMYLGQNSKIQLLKRISDTTYDKHSLKVRLDFTSNYAEKGGAIYVADNNNDGVLCQGANKEINQADCFIQTQSPHTFSSLGVGFPIYINTFFINNIAHQSGSDIYGGQLDRCTINPNTELVSRFKQYKRSHGFDYLKATTQIEQIIDYSGDYAKTRPDYLINNISKSDVLGLISSDGILNFCLDNVISPNYSHPNVSLHKGELFTVSVAVVDQVGNLVNSTVTSSLSSGSGNGHFEGGQVEQRVGNQCTELEYNVYSEDNSAQFHLHLYVEGSCGNNIEVSKLGLNLIFLPCECPVGFQPSSSKTECTCECDRRLKQHQITSCFARNETIEVESNMWIGVANSTNGSGFVIHDCPYDYCVQKPVNISLSSPKSANEQCAYNRTGSLCGMCKDLSLVFGSSSCQECSSYYIFLLIPFALAGITLVVFILILNMTVATGTIHGLIFYANILTADRSLFLPFATPNVLTVFISWLNLDLGIETCFYNGMDSYGKFLLQLAFPTYVFILIGAIIVLCDVFKHFATLLSNRNPVAALCTLILLSYSKLIRTIITALQFTYLDYPDGSREIVWLYDANISYLAISHVPRFIAAFIIFILGAVYTILLFFGQWFTRCSNRKFMMWAKNTKYNAFIDAYHAPFTPKHRYWMGLLLFTITTHNTIAAMTTDNLIPILSAGCIAHGLILLKLLNTRIYKNRLQDSLETLFLTNIVVLAIATFFARETNENQLALANTSMAISFILFLIILGYHFNEYILKGTRVRARVTQQLQQIAQHYGRHREYNLVPLEEEDDDVEEDEQMIEMQPPYTDDNDTDSINLPHNYDPPVIVPAVRYDQLREPDLDILDPITSDDYRQVNQPPAPRPRKVPTSTVIDFVRPRRNLDRLDRPQLKEL